MKRLISVLGIIILSVLGVSAQSITVNPGKGMVSKAEIAMTSYALDPEAPAVVLFSSYEVQTTIDSDRRFVRQDTAYERIKILTEEGKEYGEYEIYYSTHGRDGEHIGEIYVRTWNLQNGAVEFKDLPSKLIFNEKVTEDVSCIKFAAPSVEAGSVIEVAYVMETPWVGDIGDKYLQRDIPVNQAVLKIIRTERLGFNIIRHGYHPVQYDCDVSSNSRSEGYRTVESKIYTDTYKAVDIPAIHKTEPYCFNSDVWRLGVSYELNSAYPPGSTPQVFSITWDDVDAWLKKNGCYKDFFAKCPLEGREGIISTGMSEEENIAAARNFVASKVRWNGHRSIKPDIRKAVSSGEGSCADINALIATILNEAGYTVEPVFYRTRDRGLIFEMSAKTNAFNSVLLKVTCPSGTKYYLDGSRGEGYLNVIPVEALVDLARVIDKKGKGTWEDISNLVKNTLNMIVDLEVGPDGSISGDARTSAYNLCSSDTKLERDKYTSEEEYIEHVARMQDLEVTSLEYPDWDSWSAQSDVNYAFKTTAETVGDILYVKPFISKFHNITGFRNPNRSFPVDFPYPERINYRCTVHIPEGYEAEKLPTGTVLSFPPLGCLVRVRYSRGEGTVNVEYMFTREGRVTEADQYQQLRLFWEQLCNIYDSTIVLKKI